MTDSTVANLNNISSNGGVQEGDMFYVLRTGTPDADFRADAGDVLEFVESSATAFAVATHTHVFADVSDAGSLAALNIIGTAEISNNSVTYAKLQDVSDTDKLLGRSTAGSGDIEEIPCTAAARALLDDVSASAMRTTLGLGAVAATGSYADLLGTPTLGLLAAKSSVDLATGDATGILAASRFPALSGDIITSAGSLSATIANNAVTNSKAAQMAAGTIKGNDTGSTANAGDLSIAQVTAMLGTVMGDTGAGGTKGLVPAPASGDASAGKFLKADGTWTLPTGGNPGGSGGQVQYNNASTFAGAANLTVDGSGNANLGEYTSTNPVAPSLGTTLFSRKRTGHALPSYSNSTNRWGELMSIPCGHIVWTSANGLGNSLVTTAGGNGLGVTTGTAVAKTFDGTTFGGSISNLTVNSAGSAGSSAGYTSNGGAASGAFRGTIAGTGGFDVRFRFGIDTAVSNLSWFVGMWGASTDMGNNDPSAQTNIIGFGCDSGQTTVRFMNNDGSGTTMTTDLGANFPAATSGIYYEARLYCIPNGSTIYYSLERLETPQFTEGSVTTDIPGTTTALYPQVHICNRTTASVAKISFSKYILMQDF